MKPVPGPVTCVATVAPATTSSTAVVVVHAPPSSEVSGAGSACSEQRAAMGWSYPESAVLQHSYVRSLRGLIECHCDLIGSAGLAHDVLRVIDDLA